MLIEGIFNTAYKREMGCSKVYSSCFFSRPTIFFIFFNRNSFHISHNDRRTPTLQMVKADGVGLSRGLSV